MFFWAAISAGSRHLGEHRLAFDQPFPNDGGPTGTGDTPEAVKRVDHVRRQGQGNAGEFGWHTAILVQHRGQVKGGLCHRGTNVQGGQAVQVGRVEWGWSVSP